MKYFFLSEGWTTGRIWEFGGLWDEFAWQRKPHIQQMSLSILENGETLWLYQVEDAVLMVEVRPVTESAKAIGQVVLKRLMSAEQVLERLCTADPSDPDPVASNGTAVSAESLNQMTDA